MVMGRYDKSNRNACVYHSAHIPNVAKVNVLNTPAQSSCLFIKCTCNVALPSPIILSIDQALNSPKKFCRLMAGGVDAVNWRNRYWPLCLLRRCTVIFESWELLNKVLVALACKLLVSVSLWSLFSCC